jgi:hypothetical protein
VVPIGAREGTVHGAIRSRHSVARRGARRAAALDSRRVLSADSVRDDLLARLSESGTRIGSSELNHCSGGPGGRSSAGWIGGHPTSICRPFERVGSTLEFVESVTGASARPTGQRGELPSVRIPRRLCVGRDATARRPDHRAAFRRRGGDSSPLSTATRTAGDSRYPQVITVHLDGVSIADLIDQAAPSLATSTRPRSCCARSVIRAA